MQFNEMCKYLKENPTYGYIYSIVLAFMLCAVVGFMLGMCGIELSDGEYELVGGGIVLIVLIPAALITLTNKNRSWLWMLLGSSLGSIAIILLGNHAWKLESPNYDETYCKITHEMCIERKSCGIGNFCEECVIANPTCDRHESTTSLK